MFTGMTEEHVTLPVQLRDWFAGMALVGFMRSRGNETYNDESIRWYARTAYELADAMMAERSAPKTDVAKAQKPKAAAKQPAWKPGKNAFAGAH